MDPEEAELQNDYRYRTYTAVIEKALRNFESSSEWADLISSLGKLNKALQSNLRYSLLPKRLIIGKRLAQCLHPALPSGVHLKALETYEVIFKIIGTKWLAKDLFIYSSGLFPLLGHASMAVKPVLLGLYERYFLPLQKHLLPSLQAFITGLLPGLEEGLEVYDRTDTLLLRLSLLVGQQVFFGALWGCLLLSPAVRLPASLFIISHFDRSSPSPTQKHMLGYDPPLVVQALCLSLQDSNVLVQRNMLEILLYFFPFANCFDSELACVPVSRQDMVAVVSAASLTLLRRDMSLNRRLYAWLLGTDIKEGMVAPHPTLSTSLEEHASYYFNSYSKDLLIQALITILRQKDVETDPEKVIGYLQPFRILISLLDKPEIGPVVLSSVLLEVVRAFSTYCKQTLGEDSILSQGLSCTQLASRMKDNRNASEIIKTVNVLVSTMGSEYLWDYMTRRFCTSLSGPDDPPTPPQTDCTHLPPDVTEISTLIIFLLDIIPLELHADIQSRFLPEVLGCMLSALRTHMATLPLPELTHGLRAAFKVLSRIQMPVAYMDMEAGLPMPQSITSAPQTDDTVPQTDDTVPQTDDTMPQTDATKLQTDATVPQEEDLSVAAEVIQNELEMGGDVLQVNGHHDSIDDGEVAHDVAQAEVEAEEAVLSTMHSENSGLGISATPSGQLLPPAPGPHEEPLACREGEAVWRLGGSVDTMTECLQDILAFISTTYLLVQVEDIKDLMEAELPEAEEERQDWKLSGNLDWAAGFMPRGRAEISEAGREAFSAACHLLLECTTFPVYLSEEEGLALHTEMFGYAGRDVDGLPVWLRALMTLCCLSKDPGVQRTASATLLELINHSQSLALVIQDKHRRYQSSDANPLSGRLQMVTVPTITPALLGAIESNTDFYQRLSQVLWNQLDAEHREQHIWSVQLFYRLHCLAPSASVCEENICHALLHKDKVLRMEALHRFSVLWHLTREMQASSTLSLNRSFDRSLSVVIELLGASDGSLSASAQCWLVRALSLSDVVRILEPILLLLLHPSTRRCSIQSVRQNLSAGELKTLGRKSRSSTKSSADVRMVDDITTSHLTMVDREALWAELESDPELSAAPEAVAAPGSEEAESAVEGTEPWSEEAESAVEGAEPESEEAESAVEGAEPGSEEAESAVEGAGPESEHTESADTSEETGSDSAPAPGSTEEAVLSNGLQRVESEHTQASESLSSEDDEDLELEAMARSRLLKQEQERREAIDSLFRHVLLYPVPGGWRQAGRGLALLDSLLRSSAQRALVEALSSTSLDTSSSSHLNLVSNLLQRHQQAQDGQAFYGRLHSPAASPSAPPSLLLELLVVLCLRLLRSHYPAHISLGPHDLLGNREVQVKSAVVLTRLVNQMGKLAGQQDGLDSVRRLLSQCRVQQHALLCLSASMHVTQRGLEPRGAPRAAEVLEECAGVSEESLVNLGVGGGQEQFPLQMELLKLLQALIMLEHQVWGGAPGHPEEQRNAPLPSTPLAREWQTAVLYQQSIRAAQYVPGQPITAQGMFVAAAAKALQPQYGYAMHPHWVALLCSSLPYLGRSLGIIVAPLTSQICRNLDELVKLYEPEGSRTGQSLGSRRENIAPDYPLTLLEGLTAITHHCLLDSTKSLVACDPADVRNARNTVLEELPHMLGSMARLWGVARREDSLRRGSDSAQTTRHSSTSVYFRSTKILRQRILEFLVPVTGQYGDQLMASVGTVWGERRGRRRQRRQILPVASEARLTLVDLVRSLNTLRTDTVLSLVREVVRSPHLVKGEQKASLVDIPMLQFSYAYIQSVPAQVLLQSLPPLLTLLRESVQLNLAPPGLFLLLGILNDIVSRLPNLESRKDTRDMQEVTQKVLEAVGGVAGSSLEQTSWLSRNLEVKVQPQVCPEADEAEDVEADGDLHDAVAPADTMVSSSAPSVYSVQALTLLAEVLAPLLDMVYRSDEKDKAVPLISRLLYYVFPYLKNHSAYNAPSFRAGAQLLCSLSGYAYTKRAWKREVLELYLDPLFFTMEASCVCHWRSIIDHLLTHEKTMFKDLMSMQSSSLKLFCSADQKPMLLKRQAFALLSGEQDQYHLYLPLIQERLTDTLRVGQTPAVSAQTFLMFRVLLLRISAQHLTSLWPVMVTELIRIFTRLEKALVEEKEVSKLTKVVRGALERSSQVHFTQPELDMYLSACKFLDIALTFPPEKMPLFQMYRWAFVPEVDVDRYSGPENGLTEGEQECRPHVLRILEGIQQRFGEVNGLSDGSPAEPPDFPLLKQRSISSITQLLPFLRTLCCSSFQGRPQRLCREGAPTPHCPASSTSILRRLEQITEEEFLDSMEA